MKRYISTARGGLYGLNYDTTTTLFRVYLFGIIVVAVSYIYTMLVLSSAYLVPSIFSEKLADSLAPGNALVPTLPFHRNFTKNSIA